MWVWREEGQRSIGREGSEAPGAHEVQMREWGQPGTRQRIVLLDQKRGVWRWLSLRYGFRVSHL